MYKSVKYITTNRTTYKLLKHKDNTVDVWAMREECKNQNCTCDPCTCTEEQCCSE